MTQFFAIITEMAPYLLLGFLFAGLLHAFIPARFYGKYLSKNNLGSVVYATLLGIPLPLCSCGVIPTAMSLRKEGASKGATVSFLIATPQTGMDSILATYGLMGLPFAVIRPVAALVTALFGGALTTLFNKDGEQCDTAAQVPAAEKESFFLKLKEALRYAYVDMMQDIGRWLVLGLIVAALIAAFVPQEWFTVFEGNTWASMLLVLCISIPMYICATGSIPIAVALMLKGLTPGAALVLLMAGPACNLASILVVRKVMGRKALAFYLGSIVLSAVAFGYLVDYLQFNGVVNFLGQLVEEDACCHAGPSILSIISGVILVLLLFNALVVNRIKNRKDYDKVDRNEEFNKDKINNTASMKTYHIKGMNCNHCRQSAERAILNVNGVSSVKVSLEKGEAYVEGTASAEDIRKAVEQIGFTCTE